MNDIIQKARFPKVKLYIVPHFRKPLIYHIHLLNGEVIEASEAYDLPAEKGLVGKFEKADDNEIFEIGDAISGFAYVPKRSILFIATGDVKEGWCPFGSQDK